MVVSLQMNHDPGWGARQDGRPLAVERDRIGFVVLRPAPGTSTLIELYYAGTAEQRIFGWLAALAWVAALASVKYWKHESVAVDR
jgi:hypothetical protein